MVHISNTPQHLFWWTADVHQALLIQDHSALIRVVEVGPNSAMPVPLPVHDCTGTVQEDTDLCLIVIIIGPVMEAWIHWCTPAHCTGLGCNGLLVMSKLYCKLLLFWSCDMCSGMFVKITGQNITHCHPQLQQQQLGGRLWLKVAQFKWQGQERKASQTYTLLYSYSD